MKMVEVKTAELIGPALDFMVLIAIQTVPFTKEMESAFFEAAKAYDFSIVPAFSTDWAQGGPLIDKYKVCTGWIGDAPIAFMLDHKYKDGVRVAPTPLIAACRAIVEAKLGDVVSVPAELVNGGAV